MENNILKQMEISYSTLDFKIQLTLKIKKAGKFLYVYTFYRAIKGLTTLKKP